MPNAIEAEATRWVARLDAGPLSAEEQRELDAWLESDRRRHGAFVRARAAWLDVDRLTSLVPAQSLSRDTAEKDLRRGRVRLRIAAGLAAFAVAAGAVWLERSMDGQTYASEVGEVRRIELPDGSELTLNTNTQTTVRFKEEGRDITLVRGEALFNVAHDASRPFIVRAKDVQVKAVGTAFNVRVDGARVDVVVTEGVVEVTRGSNNSRIQRITANHRAVIASRESRLDIEPIDSAAMTRQLAWREGMVAFAGEPLSVAVDEINRYSRQTIYVDDPVLAARPIIGIFRAGDAEGFASATAATFGAEVVRTESEIHLRASAPP